MSNKRGHTFSADLTRVPERIELVPGDIWTLLPFAHNGSTTDYNYAFESINYNPDIYEIVDSFWKLATSSYGETVCSCSSGNEMIPVEMGHGVTFS